MPTFHPAYLLRNQKDKKLVWEDMQKIQALYQKLGLFQNDHDIP
jgi:uracil-DNA glycosylase